MRRWVLTALAMLLALAVLPGCNKKSAPGETSDEPGTATWTESWTPEKIAADPAGYLAYAGVQVEQQILGREERLRAISERKTEVDRKGAGIRTKLADAQNVHDRLSAAARRADDEDSWPVKFAGRTFEKARAQAVLTATENYIADVKPLAQAYAQAMQRLASAESNIQNDIVRLQRMQEKVALDLERVRLNQGVAELTELRKTESELAVFSKTLADMSDDAALEDLSALGSKAEPAGVETLLK